MASNHPKERTDLEIFTGEILNDLARRLPICLSSDEFHFFPQAVCPDADWSRWDDFSPESVAEMAERLRGWEERLLGMADTFEDPEDRLDAALLGRVLTTVREQLVRVRVHETQPTWHLTIAGIGLAEGLEAGEPAFRGRLSGLPRFLETAGEVLSGVPVLFRDLGLEMADGLRGWLKGVPSTLGDRSPAVEALDRFTARLRGLPTAEEFRLDPDLMAKILADHLGTGMTPEAIRAELLSELTEVREILGREADRILPGRSWRDALASLPSPGPSSDGGIGLYREAIEALGAHCVAAGLIDPELRGNTPVRVTPVPAYLSAVRSSAAYSMPPAHPPAGGTFFVTGAHGPDSVPKDYRLLSAHETFPGHHLLDTCRWGLARTLRRHLEFPLFYEGWACFSEELLFHTGFFEGPADRLLLAKRRFWRAMRGLSDLDLHTGRTDVAGAAQLLADAGRDPDQARAMVRRYALKPGYQVCYALGMRRFRTLFHSSMNGGHTPATFARTVLAQGEVGFPALEQRLRAGPAPP